MAVAVVDLLQIVQVKEQQSELPAAALRPFDLVIESADQTAIIGQTRQRVLCGLLSQVVFQLSLLGHVLSNNLVTTCASVCRYYFASAEPRPQGRAIFPGPIDFEAIAQIHLPRGSQQL